MEILNEVNESNQIDNLKKEIEKLKKENEKLKKQIQLYEYVIKANQEYMTKQLIDAVISENAEKVKLLVENGADVNIKDKFGCTPLYYALKYDNTNIIEYLKRYGAKE